MLPTSAPCDDGDLCTLDACGPGNVCQNGHAIAFTQGISQGFSANIQIPSDVAIGDGKFVAGFGLNSSNAKGINGNENDNSMIYAGAAYVFTLTGNKWYPEAFLKASYPHAHDGFGRGVAISGNTVAVGAPGESSVNGDPADVSAGSSGAVYVFVRDAGNWTQQALLKATPVDAGDGFGTRVALSGDYLVVSAGGEDSCDSDGMPDPSWRGCTGSGAAYVFRRVGNTWGQIAYLKPEGGTNAYTGRAIAISGNELAVCATYRCVFYTIKGDKVSERNPLSPEGISVAIDGSDAVIGQPYIGNSPGQIQFAVLADGVWKKTQTFTASNGALGDQFGSAVAISGDFALVAAVQEAGTSVGIDGSQALDKNKMIGAAYLFHRNAGVWAQVAYIKQPAANLNPLFGVALALSGSHSVIASYSEYSPLYMYVQGGEPCDDQNECTLDACTSSGCTHSNTSSECTDGIACTSDNCVNGSCVSTASDGPCDDGLECTTLDTCTGGVCTGLTQCAKNDACYTYSCESNGCQPTGKLCVDGDPCTLDACDRSTGCVFPVITSEIERIYPAWYANIDSKFGHSVGIDGKAAVVGLPGTWQTGPFAPAGGVLPFYFGKGGWTQGNLIYTPLLEEGDQFGASVAIAGRTIAVGAPGEDSKYGGSSAGSKDNSLSNSGAACVFWSNPLRYHWDFQVYLKASNPDINDAFGSAVAVDGDTIVVGAPGEDGNGSGQGDNSLPGSGAVYVFTRTGNTWTQQSYLKANPPNVDDAFGSSVSLRGNLLAVGAPRVVGSAIGAGSVFVFTRSGNSWNFSQKLVASNPDVGDRFGAAVSVGPNFLVVGAPGEDSAGPASDNSRQDAGAAYAFVNQSGTWNQEAYLKASVADAADFFGGSVGIDGEIIAIGATGEDSVGSAPEDNSVSNSGAVYLFTRTSGSWGQSAWLKSGLHENDAFGCSVALSGDYVIGGVEGSDTVNNGNTIANSGSIRIFALNRACDDGNPCTSDACGPTGCTHSSLSGPCATGMCTGGVCL